MLWTREEQSLRSSYWLSVNGVSSIVGALLAYGAGHAENLAIPQWKLIYLVRTSVLFCSRTLPETNAISPPIDRRLYDHRMGLCCLSLLARRPP